MSIQDDLIQKSLEELSAPEKPIQKSRTWTSPVGYRYLVQWSNAVLLRHLVNLFTNSKYGKEFKKKAQLEDAARSQVRNIEEGFKRATTSEYLDFIGFSQGSLEEVKGDIRDATDDGFLPSKPGSSLAGIGINLADLNASLRPKGDYRKLEEVKGVDIASPISSFKTPLKSFRTAKYSSNKKFPESDEIFRYRPLTEIYSPLTKVKTEDLTYEIFTELINKTDFLLRKLVESLEKKLSQDGKYYKVEQARIRDKFRKK